MLEVAVVVVDDDVGDTEVAGAIAFAAGAVDNVAVTFEIVLVIILAIENSSVLAHWY